MGSYEQNKCSGTKTFGKIKAEQYSDFGDGQQWNTLLTIFSETFNEI